MSNSKRTFLITGGSGFFGSHLVHKILSTTEHDVVVVDALNYAGSLDNLRAIKAYPNDRVRVITWDIRLPAQENLVRELQEVTHIIHLAAETHVDSSVTRPLDFVNVNVLGTANVLELARQLPNLEILHHASTDEVTGKAPEDENFPGFKEREIYNPSNPYSGSKAAAEMLVIAWANTYRLPCIITNLMNLFSTRQNPEKYIPKAIRYIVENKKLTIHAYPGAKKAGQRTYIEASDAADAFMFLYREQPWLAFPVTHVESYNICGSQEVDNEELACSIEEIILRYYHKYPSPVTSKQPALDYELVDFHSARPHHDTRYKLDGSKIRNLGWVPPQTFHESLKRVVEWYLECPSRYRVKE